jgi:uncharacterized protein YbjT (DUF2867 family)
MEKIVVTGSTGYIGGRLVPRLLEAGYFVRCLVREPRKLQSREWVRNSNLEIVTVELGDRKALEGAIHGIELAYFLVHSMNTAGPEYVERDLHLANTFAQASAEAGLGRIVYLGGLGETGAGLSRHLSSRRQVESALGSTGVPVTVLRAAMIIGSGSASFEILRYLVERLPIMVTPRWVSTPCQPIAIRNAIEYLVGVLSREETTGHVFDIGGTEVLTYLEIMRMMAEELGLRRRWVIPVPVLTPRLSSYWIHLVTPLSHDIAKPLAEGLKNPVVCREDSITRLVPQKLLSVREAIVEARGRIFEDHVESNRPAADTTAGDPDWAGGTVFQDSREVCIDAPPWAVFRAVCMLGGKHGWSANWLWRLRGRMSLVGGEPRRGRFNPQMVSYGETLDFWRVVRFERDRALVLRSEMKLPGKAMLEFHTEPTHDNKCRLQQLVRFIPHGLFGILYWYAVKHFHNIVFRGMLRGIKRQALQFVAELAKADESSITA